MESSRPVEAVADAIVDVAGAARTWELSRLVAHCERHAGRSFSDMPVERKAWQDLPSRRICLALILGIVVLGFCLIAYGYWPGIMIDDARWQYQQAVDNAYEDWHPPLMAWVWRRLMFIQPGPAPMLLLQLAFYWVAIGLIALWAYRRGRPVMGVVLACVGWLPIPLALTGTITKDCLMAGLLGCASGLLLWRELARGPAARLALSGGVIVVLLLAAALRFNAFLACVPLALAVLPRSLTRTKPRFVMSTLCATAALLLVGPIVNALVQAERMDAELSLIIFDLGGITEHRGVSAFPNLGVVDPVTANHRCYDVHQWDGYSSWAKKPCPLGFDAFQSRVDNGDFDPKVLWIEAILAQPLAYAEHRLAHFNVSTWFLVGNNPRSPAWSESVPNPWGFQVRQKAARAAVTAIADFTALTPLGWPIFWIALGLAAFVIAVCARLGPSMIAITASAPLYGMGFLIFGVATGMRYHLWTIIGAALAAVLVAGELSSGSVNIKARALRVAAGVVVLPTLMAIGVRVVF